MYVLLKFNCSTNKISTQIKIHKSIDNRKTFQNYCVLWNICKYNKDNNTKDNKTNELKLKLRFWIYVGFQKNKRNGFDFIVTIFIQIFSISIQFTILPFYAKGRITVFVINIENTQTHTGRYTPAYPFFRPYTHNCQWVSFSKSST